MKFKTEQEAFWAGKFGSEYIVRNQGDKHLASNLHFFSRALRSAQKPETCIEFGANVGLNLAALHLLYPSQLQYAVEINRDAVELLGQIVPKENITTGSLLDFSASGSWDLVLVKGVLIHINPDELPRAYDVIHAAALRYILVCEYYNPEPIAVPYRGHLDRLFKRDFCGELMDRFSDLTLIDYGFAYRRDQSCPQDDVCWFLMQKSDNRA